MDYENLLKQIDAEIERLKKARELLAEPATPKKVPYKVITGGAPKKKAAYKSASGRTMVKHSKKKSSTSGRFIARKRGDAGSGSGDGGTEDGGYGIVR